jgi:hypothetical protein
MPRSTTGAILFRSSSVRSSSFGRNSRAASNPSGHVTTIEVLPVGSNAPSNPIAAEPLSCYWTQAASVPAGHYCFAAVLRENSRLGGVAAPVADFFHAFSSGALEESDFVADVFEFVDVGPDFRLPRTIVGCSLAATGTTRVKGDSLPVNVLSRGSGDAPQFVILQFYILEFDENATHFLDLVVVFRVQNMLVTQQISKAKFAGFDFRFFTGVERSVFRPKLLRRIAGHPENVFVSHNYLSPI